jgi:hypothetical protein
VTVPCSAGLRSGCRAGTLILGGFSATPYWLLPTACFTVIPSAVWREQRQTSRGIAGVVASFPPCSLLATPYSLPPEGAVAFRPLNTAQLPALSSRAQFGATSAKQAERSAVDPDPNRSLNHLTVPPVPRLWGPGRAAHHHPVRRQDRANTEALRLVTRARLLGAPTDRSSSVGWLELRRKRACL